MSSEKPKILIAGASGFMGRWLLKALNSQYEIIATSRNKYESSPDESHIQWAQDDFFSRQQSLSALKDIHTAIYLVHSMLPKSRLFQGEFYDLDLLMADNFAFAAKKNGVKKIIFLSGIIPDDEDLSYHLKSRLEVEQTLSQYDTAFTSIRTGIIVGAGGSSYTILENLVKRLPMMICPQWTLNESQPVSLDFVISWIQKILENPSKEKKKSLIFVAKRFLLTKK